MENKKEENMEAPHEFVTEDSIKQPGLPIIPLVGFFILSFLLNWTVILLYQYVPFAPLQILMAWSPNISAIVVVTFVLKEENGVRNLLKGWKKWKLDPFWYLVGFSPIIMTFIMIIIAYFLLGESPNSSESPINWGYVFFMVVIMLFTGATGEELGWRGFLQPQLQTRFNWVMSSIIVGLCWGLWHLPLFVIGVYQSNLVLYLIVTVSYSIIIGWAFNKTNQSIFIASMVHYFANFSSVLLTSTGLGLIKSEVYLLLAPVLYALFAIGVIILSGVREKHFSAVQPAKE